jgi:Protein of unknown function (DUF3572)
MENHRRRGHRKSAAKAGKDAAAELAVAALAFIAGDDEQLGRFLALSGIGPDSLRSAAQEPDFLLGVLDYVAADEALLIAFAEYSEVDPLDVGRAREALAGEPPELS